MPLTPTQQQAVCAPTSVVVTAGAGTGKTHMLAERYLYYLQEKEKSPLQVVAVTFTNKAADELRSRIRSLVKNRLPHRSDIFAELEAAPISTLHSLAARICREHPQKADVPPDFEILDEQEGKLWQLQVREKAIANLPLRIFEKIPYSLLKKAIHSLLNDPISASEALAVGSFRETILNFAKERQKQLWENLHSSSPWQEAKEILFQYSGAENDALEQSRQTAVAAMAAWEAEETPSIQNLDAICKIDLRKGSKKKWQAGEFEEVKKALKNLKETIKEAYKDGLGQSLVADEQLAAALPSLQEAFELVSAEIAAARKQTRKLGFADLEAQALQALQWEEVRQYYHRRWQVFLVDEFQDTNPVQAKLLEYLTKTAEMTVVGDSKQSIYGFRRADVRVFREFRDKILAAGGTEVNLQQSFRTHVELVDSINHIFTPILAENHQDLTAFRQSAPQQPPHVEVATVTGGDKEITIDQRRRVEANYLAEKIRRVLDSETPIYDSKLQTERAIAPGDIAILARSWSPLDIYAEALAAAGIPAAIVGGENLLQTRVAKDAMALLQFLADARNDVALVAVLRSPFFAISDRVLYEIANNNDSESWWQRLQTCQHPEISQPLSVLQQLRSDRDIEPPTRLLQLADSYTGYTAVITNLPDAQRREADWRGFRDLIRRLESGNLDVFAVVRRLRSLEAAEEISIPRLPLEIENAVSLMTVHRAKGLEWPWVIVADLSRKENNQGEDIYFDPEYGVALKFGDATDKNSQPQLYRFLKQQQKQREEMEAKRLLYVALTRSRDFLLLTASNEKGGKLDILEPGLQAANISPTAIPYTSENAIPPTPPLPQPPSANGEILLDSAGLGLWELPVTALSVYHRCPWEFKLNYIYGHPGVGQGLDEKRRIGQLTHQALEGDIDSVDTLQKFDPGLQPPLVQEAIDLANNFRQHPEFAPFRQPHLLREKPIQLLLEGITLNGIADLVGDGWVLDYKTDAQLSPDNHRFQLWAYASALNSDRAYIAYLRHSQVYTFDRETLQKTEAEAKKLVQGILSADFPAKPDPQTCKFCPYQTICEFAATE